MVKKITTVDSENICALSLTLLETIPFGMDIVDEHGNILFLNKRFGKLFSKEAVGKKCWEIYRDDKKRCDDCPLKTGIKINETSVIDAPGCLGGKILRIYHTGMIYQGKKAVLEIFEDITEQKKMEEAVKEAAATKTRFASIAAHELKNPLAVMKEGVALVFDGTMGPLTDGQKRALDAVMRSIDRLSSLAKEILDFQKLEAGKLPFSIERNNVNGAVKEAYGALKSSVTKKGLKFNLKLDENLPMIKFDKGKIIEVLINLVNNSIKFTEKGHIQVETCSDRGNIHVKVQDTGHGISENGMLKLFQPFTQLEGAKQPGTGLGLAICKEIIAGHNGRIWAESKVNKGSTFHFTLPVK